MKNRCVKNVIGKFLKHQSASTTRKLGDVVLEPRPIFVE